MPMTLPILLVAGLTALSVTLMGAVMGVAEDWVWPSSQATLQLTGAPLLLGVGCSMIILAVRLGDIAVTAPFHYVTVLFAIAIGFWLWGDVPDEMTFVGSAIIVGTGIYTLFRERRRKRPPLAAPTATSPSA